MKLPLSDKFIAKYMRQAVFIASDNVPCYSRGVAAIIVDTNKNCIISQGYNGPPKGVPHCDSAAHVENYLIPMMNDRDKEVARRKIREAGLSGYNSEDTFNTEMCNLICGSKKCPRQTLDYPSGERLELCTCAHAEQNAIDVAGQNLFDSAIFISAGIPCYLCVKGIINCGIKYVFCLGNDYPKENVSLWMLKTAGLKVFRVHKEWINNEKLDIKYELISG